MQRGGAQSTCRSHSLNVLLFERPILKTLDSLSLRLRQAVPWSGKSYAARPVDVGEISETIQRALSSAGLDTTSGPLSGVTRTIEKALAAAGLKKSTTEYDRTVDSRSHEAAGPTLIAGERVETVAPPAPAMSGEFVTRSFTNQAGTRIYKLYVPQSYSAEAGCGLPLVVMLHGCKQSPDDFAAGTRMNALAEQHRFLVVYPAQSANSNGSKCWNWFRTRDQGREGGEPSIIAGIAREVAAQYRIDQRRVFVAGLSAGAAMAVILGVTYPDLFAAVGVHSGLPYAVAHDVPSAFSAMKGRADVADVPKPFVSLHAQQSQIANTVPTIVFHGDGDNIVVARNGAAIVEAALAVRERQSLRVTTQEGVSSGGRTYSRTVFADAGDNVVAEHWILRGAGHAWSGGSSAGSFTDSAGPDASAEMIRFFNAQKQAGTA